MRKRGNHSAPASAQHTKKERDIHVVAMLGEMEAYLRWKCGEGVEVSTESVIGELSDDVDYSNITERQLFEDRHTSRQCFSVRNYIKGFVYVVDALAGSRCFALLVTDERRMVGGSIGGTKGVSEPGNTCPILWQDLDGKRKCAWLEIQPLFFSPN